MDDTTGLGAAPTDAEGYGPGGSRRGPRAGNGERETHEFKVGARVVVDWPEIEAMHGRRGVVIDATVGASHRVRLDPRLDGSDINSDREYYLFPSRLLPAHLDLPTTQTKRQQVLSAAELVVSKDRNSTYGEPEDNFGRIAAMWSAYLEKDITSRDVAWLMVLLKVAREVHAPHPDNPVDVAGYAACAAEVTP